ncbi:DUF3667 domain-containing protein [Flagellimonas pacifica]|uniref:DUF3667 domain-containing protein n=1 Tax=Flagellimonas pacifica TaxID=1247520 RepID=A0A285MXK5_9FLAO|nr:DUF3667 domain-containing protein [Allomuricauda parva]SNZ01818.1 Protein of unknown function [Allomuricauda parva]
MNCKNCEASLRSDFGYCPSCGAKVIHNRLALKNVFQDLSFQVFNWDNTFLKTLRHLFSKPETVILEFISGTRKKYMNPFGFFAIAVTLSGLMYFVLRNVYDISLTQSSFSDADPKDMSFMFDYQGLMAYMIMPLYALLSWMLFRGKRKFNYTEHLVANAYIIGQTSYAQVVLYILVLGLFPVKFDIFNFVFLLVIVAYQFIVLGRMHQTKLWGTLWRAFVYLFFLMVLMMGIGIVAVIITLMTGQVSLEDFAPK